jgi:hypothetical protein
MKLRVVLLALVLAACASSRPGGGGTDGSTDGTVTDDGSTTDDGSPTDDGLTIDGLTIDGTVTDGAIDAPAIDAAVDATVDANTCPTLPCDLHVQCGCTPPLTCDIDFTDLMGTSCRAVNVPGTETSTCASFSECAAGHVCVGGRCHRYCSVDGDCSQPRGLCAIQLTDQMSNPIPGATTCSSNCNPIDSAAGGCPAGQKCGFFEGIGMRDIVDCTTPGAGAIGATCTTDATCSSNTYCTTYNTQTRCRKVCNRTTGGSECAAVPGTTCVGFTTPLTIGGTEYGICAP